MYARILEGLEDLLLALFGIFAIVTFHVAEIADCIAARFFIAFSIATRFFITCCIFQ